MVGIDSSLLLGFYQARTGQTSGLATGATGTGKVKYAPTAPWATNSGAARASALVETVMSGRRFIDENAAVLDLPGSSADYKKLFALFQGLNALTGLAERMSQRGVTDVEKSKIQKLFIKGLSETTAYADSLKLEQMRLTRGEAMTSDKTKVGVPRADYNYTTATLHTGTSTEAVSAFAGSVAFDIQVKRLNTTQTINIDLSEMGATTRSMSNVASFINGKLQDAGVITRFNVSRTPGEPKIVQTGGTKVTLPAEGDKYAFKVVGESTETVTFSAATTKPAVYVATTAGNPDPDKDPKTKDAVYTSSLIKTEAGSGGGVGSKVFSNGLEKTVTAVKAQEIGPDGSVYMLAEVSGDIDGQAIKGTEDVALLKYDSQGKLMFARTLGAVGDTTANALAVSADGQVAIAGSIVGQLDGVTNGPINSGPSSKLTDSFVTLFDAKGDEVWTSRRGALQDDEATAVAFGADGTVYVGGRAKSSMPGSGGGLGGWDGYLTAVKTGSTGAPQTLFTQTIGGAGEEAVTDLAVDGNQVIVGSMEDKHAVLRSFDVTGGILTAGATRDLGDLLGGSLAGMKIDGGQLYVGGSTRNGALALGTPSLAYSDGMDGFAGRLSLDLSSTADDALAYFGGSKDDTVTGMAVANGKVWLTGLAGADMPGVGDPIASQDGYLVEIDPLTGTYGSAQRLTGKDGYVTPTAIAVDASGASALDRLGLPKGTLTYTDSQLITSATSARAGDSFQIRTREGGPLTSVTLAANDTLETLMAKVKRAAGYRAKVEIVSETGFRRLKISPANDNAQVEILPGKNGKNMLESIGLAEGVVRRTTVNDAGRTVSANGGGNVYGLALANDINLATDDAVRNAQLVLSKAMSAIRTAYKDLETAAKPPSLTNPSASGPVPAYLSDQIANYQAALQRLGG